ncbi:MAG: hypothetical protein ACP5RP_03005 [Candidatus Micrarchaeia archaeon]
MTQKSKGKFNGSTRNIARHNKLSVLSTKNMIKEFNVGDKVAIVPKGNIKNAPDPRFRGIIGTITGKRGKAYTVKIKVFSTTKEILVPALHLEAIASKKE